MIVVRIIGGLGNQMFQYAAGRAVADRLGVELLLDLRGMSTYRVSPYRLDRLTVRTRPASARELRRWPTLLRLAARFDPVIATTLGFFTERGMHFNVQADRIRDNTLLDGYFQSEKYFAAIAANLRREFVPREPLSAQAQLIAESAEESASVMIHVRRGDYVSNETVRAVHGLCSVRYYDSAIEAVRARVANPRFFVFSDDIAWTRQNINVSGASTWISGNEPEVDLHLMSKCRHHIIANSSFSWWGAWLGEKPGAITIAPTPWFDVHTRDTSDLLPIRWNTVVK